MFFQQLSKLMVALAEHHQLMLDTLLKESDLPASCSLADLRDNHRQRDQTAQKILDLEKERQELMTRFILDQQLKCDVRLKSLLHLCEPPLKKGLLSARKKILELVEKIKTLARKNAEKAITRINCLNEVQGAVNKALKRQSLYNVKGRMDQPKGSCFVRKSI